MFDSMSIKKNDTINVKITDMNNLGAGVGHYPDEGGITVFVRGAVTGEVVSAKVIKVASSYLVGRLCSVIEPSPYRACEGDRALCSAPASCGGCCYRNVKYDYELEIKKNYVINAFRKAGMPDVTVEDVMSTGDICGYRNKGQYPIRATRNGLSVGFFANKTHDMIPCDECLLQPRVFSEILNFAVAFATEKGISAYDEESGRGILRHIYLREGKQSGEIMVCMVINAEKMPYAEEFAESLVERFPRVVSVMLNINRKNTNVILGEKFLLVKGRDYIEDTLCGVRLRISAGSFYQVNHDAAELLYSLAREKAELSGNEILADLYCGTGSIGLSMADRVRMLVGIDIVDEAIACARKNAEINGIENAYFYCGDASDTEGLLGRAKREIGDFVPDVVVIDPPRRGTTEELANYIDRLGVCRVVYVSCDPDTLARDCAYFSRLGYIVGAVSPVDLFPGTGHVECVCLLCREDGKNRRE